MRVSRDSIYLVCGSALLLAAPVIQVARNNLESIVWSDFWITLIIAVGFPVILIVVLLLIFRNKFSIAASVAILLALSTYHLEMDRWFSSFEVAIIDEIGAVGFLLWFFPVLLVFLALLPWQLISSMIGAVGMALFALSIVQLALSDDLARFLRPTLDPMSLMDGHPLPQPAQATAKLPDIIYIVPDRYGSSGVLASTFQHDNGGFLNELRRRGFFVADDARANYLKTSYSLSTSMNMQYSERLLQRLDGETKDHQPLYSLIQQNLVTARLKEMGYRYIHLPSWWDGTRQSKQSDITVDFLGPGLGGEFGRAVLQRSPFIRYAMSLLMPINLCDSFKQQLAYMETVGGDDRPTFTFAHVLAPHNPILVNADGQCIEEMDYPMVPLDGTWDAYKAGYSGFVTYLNRRFLEIFDRQKASNPNPLVFVIQADEGPYPKAHRESNAAKKFHYKDGKVPIFDWREATDAQLAMKFGILNALYLGDPSEGDGFPVVPDTLSPVNNWRVIFGKIDGKDYPLLPDRHFIFPTDDEPYHSIEITDQLDAIPR
jgi:hypothetical protein